MKKRSEYLNKNLARGKAYDNAAVITAFVVFGALCYIAGMFRIFI